MTWITELLITVFFIGAIVYFKTKPKVKPLYPDLLYSDKYKVKGRYD